MSELSPKTRRWLIDWARQCIRSDLDGRAPEDAPEDTPEAARAPSGCFVSLHGTTGSLRGCIGTFSADEPLWQNVRDMGIAAATRDPRFPALKPSELADCVLEISVLSPSRIASADEVEVGVHGVTVSKGGRRGVLLPQVAVSHGWDRETFLDHTCLKAGLNADEWRDGSVEIAVFCAEVFEE